MKVTALIVGSLVSLSSAALAQTAISVTSVPLQTFQDSLGVNDHINYTDGLYSNAPQVLADLKYIGVHNVRDGIPSQAWASQGYPDLLTLAAGGMKFDLVLDPNSNVTYQEQQLDAIAAKYPSAVAAVEGPNEINNFPIQNAPSGDTQEQAAESMQAQLFSYVHGDSLLKNTQVYYFTGGAMQSSISGLADAANGHPYPHGGDEPTYWYNNEYSTHFSIPGTYPKVATETGYATIADGSDWDGVDEPGQAELLLNTYFDAMLLGVSRTYVYQLLEAYPNDTTSSDTAYGLFHYSDGSPKIAAVALNHLSTLMPADKVSAHKAVTATFTGLPSTAKELALTASDGSIYLYVWNEVPVWNPYNVSLEIFNYQQYSVSMAGKWTVSYLTPALSTAIPTTATKSGSYLATLNSYPTALHFVPAK